MSETEISTLSLVADLVGRGGQCGPRGLHHLAEPQQVTTLNWAAIEREFSAGQLSIREIARQHGVSDTAIRKRAKEKGWTRDLAGAVRSRVRDSLVREGVRANELAGATPSHTAIVDAAAARGVEVVRSHRRDIDALRQAAAGLLSELRLGPVQGAPAQRDRADGILLVPLKVTERSRVRAVERRTGHPESPSVGRRNIGTGSGSAGISPSGSGASMPSTCRRA